MEQGGHPAIMAFREALAAEFPDVAVEIVFQNALQLPFGPLTRTFVVHGERLRVVTATDAFMNGVSPAQPEFQEAIARVVQAMRESQRQSLYLILDWVDGTIRLR